MEPVTLVVTALVAGATAGVTNAASAAVADAYKALKKLVVGLLRHDGAQGQAIELLVDNISASEQDKDALTEALVQAGVDDPTQDAAQKLLDLIEADKRSKFKVDASQAKGVIIGDHGTQNNTFS